MKHLPIVISALAALPLLLGAGPPSDESPGPTCEGIELGITRGQVAESIAYHYCLCNVPQAVASCTADITSQLLAAGPQDVLCGTMFADGVEKSVFDVIDECQIAACTSLPWKCWQLGGWPEL